MLNQKQIDALPEKVRRAVASMSDRDRRYFERQFIERKEKTSNIFFVALVAMHYFFTGRAGAGAAFWLLTLLGLLIWPLLIITVIWWAAEILSAGSRTRDHNGRVAWSIVQEIKDLGELDARAAPAERGAPQDGPEPLRARR